MMIEKHNNVIMDRRDIRCVFLTHYRKINLIKNIISLIQIDKFLN